MTTRKAASDGRSWVVSPHPPIWRNSVLVEQRMTVKEREVRRAALRVRERHRRPVARLLLIGTVGGLLALGAVLLWPGWGGPAQSPTGPAEAPTAAPTPVAPPATPQPAAS